MKRAVTISIVLVLALACAVPAAYAYNAYYQDSFEGQDVAKKYAVLLSEDYNGNVSIDAGVVKFDDSSVLNMNYYDYGNSPCYLVISFTGVGAGKTVTVTVAQNSVSKTFTGSAIADSSGMVTVSGFGPIVSASSPNQSTGDFTVSATVTGYASNDDDKTITISAYPQIENSSTNA